VRETFLANQLGHAHTLEFPESGDFLVDEYGYDKKIPLWLFGFLY
jgi:hypothetical protein